MSEPGIRLLSEMMPSPDRPQFLRGAVAAGLVLPGDLPELIWWGWAMVDEPTTTVSEDEWLAIFRRAGYFSWPQPVPRPMRAVTLYRGATAGRVRRMSWTGTREVAVLLGHRHAHHQPAALYHATVLPGGILAMLGRQGEGWTVVVDPAALRDLRMLEAITLPPCQWAGGVS